MTDEYLWNFARKESYKQYIRGVVQDEVFMQTMRSRFFDQLNLNTTIKNEALSIVPQLTTNHLHAVLGGMVSEKISHSLPTFLNGYLNNNQQMQSILDRHSKQLQRTLNLEADKILEHANQLQRTLNLEADKILETKVRDPKYHTVNKLYFQAFEEKSDKAIRDWTAKADSTLHDQQTKINELEKRVRTNEQCINLLMFGLGVAGVGLCALASNK
jgi:hypothetical protein